MLVTFGFFFFQVFLAILAVCIIYTYIYIFILEMKLMSIQRLLKFFTWKSIWKELISNAVFQSMYREYLSMFFRSYFIFFSPTAVSRIVVFHAFCQINITYFMLLCASGKGFLNLHFSILFCCNWFFVLALYPENLLSLLVLVLVL